MFSKFILAILFLACLPSILFAAQPKDSLSENDAIIIDSWEKISVKGGAFLTSQSSSLRFGSEQYGVGLDVNFEDALGLDVFTFTSRVDLLYRFSKNKKHGLNFGYYSMIRNASKDLETELDLGDYTFSAGTTIGTKFKMSIIKFDYAYSFYMDERISLTASAGLFILPTSFSIQADDKKEEQTDFVAPLPVVGLGTEVKITPKFALINSADLFYLSFDEFEGVMLDLNVSLEYTPWDHVGFGLGYNSFSFDFALHSSNDLLGGTVAEVAYKYAGILLYGKVMF